MKYFLSVTALLLIVTGTPALAHYPAEDFADEDIDEFIDRLVAVTPHADMTFNEMGGGMTETTVTFDSLKRS